MEVASLAATDTYFSDTTGGMKVTFRKAKMRRGENVESLTPGPVAACSLVM